MLKIKSNFHHCQRGRGIIDEPHTKLRCRKRKTILLLDRFESTSNMSEPIWFFYHRSVQNTTVLIIVMRLGNKTANVPIEFLPWNVCNKLYRDCIRVGVPFRYWLLSAVVSANFHRVENFARRTRMSRKKPNKKQHPCVLGYPVNKDERKLKKIHARVKKKML